MAQLTPQERQQAFAQNFEQLVQKLAETYGFRPVALLQSRQLNDGMIQAEAVIGIQAVPNWQPPAEQKEHAEDMPILEATAPHINGKRK